MPYSVHFLNSDKAVIGRAQRIASYKSMDVDFKYAVWVEVRNHQFIELDARTYLHAQDLMKAWLTKHGAYSAAIHKVMDDGTLRKDGRIYDYRLFEDEAWAA